MPDTVTTAVKSDGAPLVGAPARYLSGKVRAAIINLVEPLEYGGVEYYQLTAVRLDGKKIFAANAAADNGVTREAAMFAAMCSVPVEVIEALDAADINQLAAKLQAFMPQSPQTAEDATGNSGETTPGK